MIRKSLPIFCFALICLTANCQTFYLPSPDGWETETFPIPIDFAPDIKYKGEEHIRFTPGWADVKNEEHWSYCFLWWIEPGSLFTEESLNHDLRSYYSGLIRANLVETKVKAASTIQTETSFKKIKTAPGDRTTFEGTVRMYNYMTTNSPVLLNVDVHVIDCGAGNTAVFFAVSPQLREHAVWSRLNAIRAGFKCNK
jgi:hypothetical protein